MTTAPPAAVTDPATDFEPLRPYLFAVAYRLLSSAADAEDAVQDAYLRDRATPTADVRSPKAYFATLVTRLCLDRLKSARTRREVYPGPWLPEPVPTTDAAAGPAETAERRDQVSFAVLLLLERLGPEERAAYVLREAFSYSYAEIGEILDKSPPAVRQLVHRARERVLAGQPRFAASAAERQLLTERFLSASERGDLHALTDVLAPNATYWADGGPRVTAARRPIVGRDNIARLLLGLGAMAPADLRLEPGDVNGGAALLLWSGGALFGVLALDGRDGQIDELRFVINPDKLAYLQRRLGPPSVRPA